MCCTLRESIRSEVQRGAERLELTTEFREVRRKTDLVFVEVSGSRDDVFALPAYVLKHRIEVDLELFNARYSGGRYTVTMVVTRKLNAQPVALPERRAKLQRFVSQPLKAA